METKEIEFGDFVTFKHYRGHTSGIVVGFKRSLDLSVTPDLYLVKVDIEDESKRGAAHNGGSDPLTWGDKSVLNNDGLWFLEKHLTVVDHGSI